MDMYKVAFHTVSRQLDSLDFLLDSNAEIIGSTTIQHFAMSNASQPLVPAANGSGSAGSLADTKIEIFVTDPSVSLLQQLAATEAVFDLQINRGTAFDFSQWDADGQSTEPERNKSEKTEVNATATCVIRPDGAGGQRLMIEGAASAFFLEKIFYVLGSYHLPVQSGRKFRQGTKDFAILTVTPTNSEVLAEIAATLRRDLNDKTISARHSQPLHGQDLSVADLSFSLQEKGNLSTLTISATTAAAPFRQKMHMLFCDFDFDISIARMLTRGNTLEDTYHLRTGSAAKNSRNLLHLLQSHLQGEDICVK